MIMEAIKTGGGGIVPANDDPTALIGSPGIGGNGAAMLPDAVIAWARAAAAGERVVYCKGHIQAWAATGRRMRELQEAGLVDLTMNHRADPKEYIAIRRSKPWPVGDGKVQRIARPVPSYDPHIGALFDHLRELASEGAPCPSNIDLARAVGLETARQGSYLLTCLVQANKVRNTATRDVPGRIITIVSTGRQTGTFGGVA